MDVGKGQSRGRDLTWVKRQLHKSSIVDGHEAELEISQ